MKQIIVLVAMISLGVFIATLVFSDEDGSVKSSLGKLWEAEISGQQTYP